MKRFFISVVVAMGCYMAQAQSLTIPAVNIIPGSEKSVDVAIPNGTDLTAFQFDIALPTGVSLKGATINGTKPDTREIVSGKVGDKYRVLSYDMQNTKFASDAVLSLTFEAAGETPTGESSAGVNEIVFVDPEGNQPSVTGGNVAINVVGGSTITVPAGLKLAMVSDKDLDFSDLASEGVKAYICTGYEVSSKTFWMTRVNDVPANTPILVKAETAGDYNVPVVSTRTYYPKNFLVGDATANVTLDKSGTYINYGVSKSTGAIGALPDATTTFEKGKAYFQVPATVATNPTAENQSFTMGKNGTGSKLLTVSDYDLDFSGTEDVKAYIVTGFDFDRTIWLSRVMTVPAGTPILLRGANGGTYSIPSKKSEVDYVNMLDGNTSSEPVTLSPETDGNTIFVMSLSTGVFGTLSNNASMVKGKAWLPVPTWFVSKIPSASRGMGMNADVIEEESEVIVLRAIVGEDGTTSIRAIEESQNEVWYNLNGQRIDTPTKKGLYIKNGKKVIVK